MSARRRLSSQIFFLILWYGGSLKGLDDLWRTAAELDNLPTTYERNR